MYITEIVDVGGISDLYFFINSLFIKELILYTF